MSVLPFGVIENTFIETLLLLMFSIVYKFVHVQVDFTVVVQSELHLMAGLIE